MRVLSILVLIVVTGCASALRSPVAFDDFKEAVARNDIGQVYNLLRNKSFATKSVPFLDGDQAAHDRYFAYSFMDLAITGRYGNSIGASTSACRPDVVRVLLDADLPPRATDLSNAAKIPCPDVANVLLTKLTEDEIKKGIDLFAATVVHELQEGAGNSKSQGWLSIVRQIKTRTSDTASLGKLAAIETAATKISDANSEYARNVASVKQSIEDKHKIQFCNKPDLFQTVYMPFGNQVEQKCIYIIHAPLKVLQATNGGVLLTLMEPSQHLQDKIIFVKTKKAYVDGDRVGDILVRLSGTMKYRSVMGAEKTIQTFDYLSDVKLVAGNGINDYSLAPDQN